MQKPEDNCYFIAPLEFLEVESLSGDSIEIMPGLWFRTDSHRILDIFGTAFVRAAGVLEYETLLKTPVVAYGEIALEDMRQMHSERQVMHPQQFILVMFLWLRPFLRSLWLIKDHNINVGNSFCVQHAGTPKMTVSSNYMSDRFLRVDGRRSSTVFTADEISQATIIHDRLESYLNEKESRDIDFMMAKTFSRIGRAIQFLEAGRSSKNLAFRITHCCSAFETLFSTETTELAHRLSERIACFATERSAMRREIYAKVKRAYAVRSKLTHGDVLSPKQVDELSVIAAECDQLLRQCLKKIISDADLTSTFDAKNEVLEDFLFRLLFPG